MEGSVDLTIQSIHGTAWRQCGANGVDDIGALSAIKAHVSFSGSVPNMKVSSFAICPDKGKLFVESDTHEIVETSEKETKMNPQKTRLLNTTFTDPFEEQRLHNSISSNTSSSSSTSSSSYRPHLHFDLREEKVIDATEIQDLILDPNADRVDVGSMSTPQHDMIIKLHITFRSVDGDAISISSEGVAELRIRQTNFENLPLTLDLPITQPTCGDSSNTVSENVPKNCQILFGSSSSIRVRLDDASKRQQYLATQTTTSQEYILSDHVDEIQLVGMVKKIHEYEERGKIRDDEAEPKRFGVGNNGKGKRRLWSFACGGTGDVKHSIKAFFDEMRNKTKCVDLELATNPTMTSTIITRESLDFENIPKHHFR